LLRVLEEHTFQRIGGTKSIFVDFRLVAATNVSLKEAVAKRHFRDDLYYRLNVITITLPELCERPSDIPLLISHVMERFKGRSRVQSVSPYALELLLRYSWPGNVRELVNAVEYAMVMSKGTQIMPTDLPENIQDRQVEQQQNHETVSLRDTEKDLIIKTLRDCHGNKHLAAKILRIPRSTLYSKLQKHGIHLDTRVESGAVQQNLPGGLERLAVQN
jgi:two-component system response regulator HydG